ncbi:MFS transporter [Streptomyces acidicola]|uniref:MFS transporter n=1 Tax=Streptomyces acidicola TaxID=2596892 RepID=UPI003447EC66
MVTCLVIGSTQISARLVNRVRTRFLMGPGFLLAALGMLLTRLEPDSSYPAHVLPSTVMIGIGMGMALMPGMSLATARIRPQDAGVASATVNTFQQVGGSIGTALLNTLAASATSNWLASRAVPGMSRSGSPSREPSTVCTVAYGWACGVMALASLIAFALINGGGRTAAVGPQTPGNRPMPLSPPTDPAPPTSTTDRLTEARGPVKAKHGTAPPRAPSWNTWPCGRAKTTAARRRPGRRRPRTGRTVSCAPKRATWSPRAAAPWGALSGH